jgi:hypothetical protein
MIDRREASAGEPRAPRLGQSSRLLRIFRPLLRACWFVFRALVVLWATLVIYYSNLPWAWARIALAVAFAAFCIWALWYARRPRIGWLFTGVFLAIVAWFASIPPSHDRPWRPEVAVMPRAIIDGDRVKFTGYRHFDFRSISDFTPHYEEREVDLSHLVGCDLIISYFMPGPVAHTYVSFTFDNALPVCISIETRPEVGEGFAPIASMFKQFELIYVVGDERDLIRLRTNFRGEETFLYPIQMTPERARDLFRVYLERINELADRPEWYHLLKNSCTINIVRYANRSGREGGFDIRHLINGWADRYLYRAGLLESTLPFDEIRRRSRITDVSVAAGTGDDYSQKIRAELPR